MWASCPRSEAMRIVSAVGEGTGEPTASRLIFRAAARYRSIRGRRHAQHAGDVVKAVAGVVSRQEVGDVDIEVQQVPDDVVVLGPAESVQRLGATGVRVGDRRAVKLGLEPGPQRVVGRLVWPGARLRRHGAGSQLADHLLPDLGRAGDVGEVESCQRESPGAEPVVVAGDAVLVKQRALGCHSDGRGTGLPSGGARGCACGTRQERHATHQYTDSVRDHQPFPSSKAVYVTAAPQFSLGHRWEAVNHARR